MNVATQFVSTIPNQTKTLLTTLLTVLSGAFLIKKWVAAQDERDRAREYREWEARANDDMAMMMAFDGGDTLLP